MISFRDYMDSKVKEYYSSRIIGQDFFTAPYLDKVFGQTLAEFIAPYIEKLKNPTILELGAGTGQLAYDILSYLKEENKSLYAKLSYKIYDFSTPLIQIQKRILSPFLDKVDWVDEIPSIEGVVIANEFFDCLPVHVIKDGKELYIENGKEVWKETEDKRIYEFVSKLGYRDFDGILEICLDCIDFIEKLSKKVKGYVLIIDYGYTSPSEYPKGSVVGYKSHKVVSNVISDDVFDITAHVNFSALIEYGKDFGLQVLVFQSLTDFLIQSQLFSEELQTLASKEDANSIERLSRLKTMLLSMGPRFKVLFQSTLNSSS